MACRRKNWAERTLGVVSVYGSSNNIWLNRGPSLWPPSLISAYLRLSFLKVGPWFRDAHRCFKTALSRWTHFTGNHVLLLRCGALTSLSRPHKVHQKLTGGKRRSCRGVWFNLVWCKAGIWSYTVQSAVPGVALNPNQSALLSISCNSFSSSSLLAPLNSKLRC